MHIPFLRVTYLRIFLLNYREDSDIALNVLEGLMHSDIGYSNHESFIVKRKDSHKLKEVMRKAIPSCYIH